MGFNPFSRAANALASLNVEPGCEILCVAILYKGLGARKSLASSGNKLIQSLFEIPVTKRFGS